MTIDTQHYINASTRFTAELSRRGISLTKITKKDVPTKPKRTNKFVQALSRSAMVKTHVPIIHTLKKGEKDVGDLHASPLGEIAIYDEWYNNAVTDWYYDWVTKHFPEKILEVIGQPYVLKKIEDVPGEPGGNLLMYRGMHSVYDEDINVPHYRNTKFETIAWKGLINHVELHNQEDFYIEEDLLMLFKKAMKQLFAKLPLPKAWGPQVNTKEWFSKLHSKSNSGWPHYVRQSAIVTVIDDYNIFELGKKEDPSKGVEYRQWLFDRYFDDILKADFKNWMNRPVM